MEVDVQVEVEVEVEVSRLTCASWRYPLAVALTFHRRFISFQWGLQNGKLGCWGYWGYWQKRYVER